MTHLPTSRWSQALNFTESELNAYLEELGFQTRITSGGKTRWCITGQGAQHGRMSRNPFRRVPLWDFEEFFQAVKLRGKKTGQYYYCENCGDYLSDQYGFEFSMKKWVCKKCGVVNELCYEPPVEVDRVRSVARQIPHTCSSCGKSAAGIDEMQTMFGFERDNVGRIVPMKTCKHCQMK